jgi:hypothetical protein
MVRTSITPTLGVAVEEMGGLEARVEALEAELAVIRNGARPRPRAVETTHAEQRHVSAGPSVSDRRGVVKLLAASAVGAVAATALHGRQAAADDGDPVLLGDVNEATTLTEIHTSDDTALYLQGEGGYGLQAWGFFGNALFSADGGAPLGREAFAGTLIVDENGNWWAATKSDIDDGQWRKLAGPETAGALHLLSAPKRVYDSRPGESPTTVGPKIPLAPNSARSIDPTGNSSGVPSSARGVLITLTIAAPTAGGFATAWPGGPWPGTSNINYNANQNIATTTVVGLGSDSKILVLANVTTHFLIDIVGYYL